MYKRSKQGWVKHIDFILWDVLILQVAFIAAFLIRHSSRFPYTVPIYRTLAIVLIGIDFLVAAIFNTMHNVMKRGYFQEFVQTLRHVAIVLALMSLYLFSTQSGDAYSRIIIYLTAAFHLGLGYLFRICWKPVIRRIGRRRKNKATMILIARESEVAEIAKKASALDGFEYAGLVLTDRDSVGETIAGIKTVATIRDAADYICREWVDEVFISPSHFAEIGAGPEDADGDQGRIIDKLVDQCRQMAVPVHLRLPISGDVGKSFLEKVGGYEVLTASANYATPGEVALKRIMDILGGLVGSFIALIIMAIVGPKIKRESPGPILFRQTRIGLNGKRFVCYKIRSMYMDAEERKQELLEQNRVSDGMMFKLEWDPRIIGNKIVDGKQVTGIGEKIRSLSLDEFPQFFNVLKGDMSLVGTRPPTADEWEKYKYHHRARLATKPGLTGMWQVSGRSRITDFEEVVRLDTYYINNWSIGLDLKILFKTIKAVIKRDGAM